MEKFKFKPNKPWTKFKAWPLSDHLGLLLISILGNSDCVDAFLLRDGSAFSSAANQILPEGFERNFSRWVKLKVTRTQFRRRRQRTLLLLLRIHLGILKILRRHRWILFLQVRFFFFLLVFSVSRLRELHYSLHRKVLGNWDCFVLLMIIDKKWWNGEMEFAFLYIVSIQNLVLA